MTNINVFDMFFHPQEPFEYLHHSTLGVVTNSGCSFHDSGLLKYGYSKVVRTYMYGIIWRGNRQWRVPHAISGQIRQKGNAGQGEKNNHAQVHFCGSWVTTRRNHNCGPRSALSPFRITKYFSSMYGYTMVVPSHRSNRIPKAKNHI